VSQFMGRANWVGEILVISLMVALKRALFCANWPTFEWPCSDPTINQVGPRARACASEVACTSEMTLKVGQINTGQSGGRAARKSSRSAGESIPARQAKRHGRQRSNSFAASVATLLAADSMEMQSNELGKLSLIGSSGLSWLVAVFWWLGRLFVSARAERGAREKEGGEAHLSPGWGRVGLTPPPASPVHCRPTKGATNSGRQSGGISFGFNGARKMGLREEKNGLSEQMRQGSNMISIPDQRPNANRPRSYAHQTSPCALILTLQTRSARPIQIGSPPPRTPERPTRQACKRDQSVRTEGSHCVSQWPRQLATRRLGRPERRECNLSRLLSSSQSVVTLHLLSNCRLQLEERR